MTITNRASIVVTLRAMLLSVGATEVSDEQLHESIEQGKKRLDKDRPRRRTDQLVGDGGNYYDVTALAGWVRGTSIVLNVQNPEPIVANDDPFKWDSRKTFVVQDIGGTEFIIIQTGITNGKNALVEYTSPWLIEDVELAASTDIEARYENAIEFISMSLVCRTLAAKAASTMDSSIPGDMISWRTKEAEYRRVADSYEDEYKKELGLDKIATPAIIVRGDYDLTGSHGGPYLTHRSTRR